MHICVNKYYVSMYKENTIMKLKKLKQKQIQSPW